MTVGIPYEMNLVLLYIAQNFIMLKLKICISIFRDNFIYICIESCLSLKNAKVLVTLLQYVNNYTVFNPTALRKAKIVYNFGLSACNRVKK